ncbi:hypothetical protein TRM7615_00626 [Falsiruegeria mediterranea M17]|uniref:Uncharacterized protein n=1 Tax=Falsiruegeria mediterranea M17 TaxID=1200281 RepID=A0A2R8C3Y7_9RHOB|nr:hypothetical protein TRM7615_00626 [Falsiruegeria mediterranea M17]
MHKLNSRSFIFGHAFTRMSEFKSIFKHYNAHHVAIRPSIALNRSSTLTTRMPITSVGKPFSPDRQATHKRRTACGRSIFSFSDALANWMTACTNRRSVEFGGKTSQTASHTSCASQKHSASRNVQPAVQASQIARSKTDIPGRAVNLSASYVPSSGRGVAPGTYGTAGSSTDQAVSTCAASIRSNLAQNSAAAASVSSEASRWGECLQSSSTRPTGQ